MRGWWIQLQNIQVFKNFYWMCQYVSKRDKKNPQRSHQRWKDLVVIPSLCVRRDGWWSLHVTPPVIITTRGNLIDIIFRKSLMHEMSRIRMVITIWDMVCITTERRKTLIFTKLYAPHYCPTVTSVNLKLKISCNGWKGFLGGQKTRIIPGGT